MGTLGTLLYPDIYNNKVVLSNRSGSINEKAVAFNNQTRGVSDLMTVIYNKIK